MKQLKLHGLEVRIEHAAGSVREGVNKATGEKWEREMTADYGYILGTNSPDGEKLDCYVRRDPGERTNVYVVHQLTLEGDKFDEDKVMLGYGSPGEARAAWESHMPKPRKMYGGISEFDPEHFKVIAFQASDSRAILCTEAMFERLKSDGLIPPGVKNPVQVAKAVSEGYFIVSKFGRDKLVETGFASKRDARMALVKFPPPVARLYEVRHFGGDAKTSRILTEGLLSGDLEDILMPRISIDEYVSKDSQSGNVVVAFFVKNVPEAVEPLREFCDRCEGVAVTDSGDSDTIPNASIVYVEFSRADVTMDQIRNMVKQVAALGGLQPEDFHIRFPHIDRNVPYGTRALEIYFHTVLKRI